MGVKKNKQKKWGSNFHQNIKKKERVKKMYVKKKVGVKNSSKNMKKSGGKKKSSKFLKKKWG